MKRYEPELGSTYYGHPVAEMAEDERGEYMRFDDHAQEIAALHNELTAARLERDRVKHSRDALAYLHYGHYMVQRTRESIQADIEACESALTALRRELAALSEHPSGEPTK